MEVKRLFAIMAISKALFGSFDQEYILAIVIAWYNAIPS
jgi:hypothetical protein